jgi:cytochrome c-type biogenesis protein CcmF
MALAVSIIAFLAFDISLTGAAALGGGVGIIISHFTQANLARKSPSGRKLAPMIVAHIGVGLFAISGAASVIFAQSGDRAIAVGESKTIAGYEVTLMALNEGHGANYFSATGEVHLKKDGRAPIILYPEFGLAY